MTKVLATWFKDCTGNHDNNLCDGKFWYAELSGKLGNLPHLQKAKITYKGHTETARKGDIGSGGNSHAAIDLHKTLANKLKFTGKDYVIFKKI